VNIIYRGGWGRKEGRVIEVEECIESDVWCIRVWNGNKQKWRNKIETQRADNTFKLCRYLKRAMIHSRISAVIHTAKILLTWSPPHITQAG